MASVRLMAPCKGSGLAAAELKGGDEAECQDLHAGLLHQPTMVSAEVAQSAVVSADMPHLRRLLSKHAQQASEPAASVSHALHGRHPNRVHPEPPAGISAADNLLYETPRCHATEQHVAVVVTAFDALPRMRIFASCLLAKELATTYIVPDPL